MSKEINLKAKIGSKIDEDEIGDKKVGKTSPTPPEGTDVEAQWHDALLICPYCGATGHAVVSDYVYEYFDCYNCGRSFRA